MTYNLELLIPNPCSAHSILILLDLISVQNLDPLFCSTEFYNVVQLLSLYTPDIMHSMQFTLFIISKLWGIDLLIKALKT